MYAARPANHRRGRDLPPPISAQALRAPRERGGTMYQGHWTLVVSARCSRPMGDGRPDHTSAAFAHATAPPIVGRSHDLLLELTLRESGCGLASLPEGSEAGLQRLARGEVMVAAIHLHRLPRNDKHLNCLFDGALKRGLWRYGRVSHSMGRRSADGRLRYLCVS